MKRGSFERHQDRRGQALVLCVLSIAMLMGILALASELGWARYVQRRAQSAADAAALAAAEAALEGRYAQGDLQSAGTQSATPCPSSGSLEVGCSYAEENGFESGGDYGRQTLTLAAGSSSTPPGAPGVTADYWVEATATHRIPQFFSPLISTAKLIPGARATAVLREMDNTISMHLLNRSEDCFVSAAGLGLVCGEDFLGVGSNDITAPGGIYMSSSNGSGLGLPDIAAGVVLGSVTVDAPFTYLMGEGAIGPLLGLGSVDWDYENGFPDGDYFTDPMAGRMQPPAPTGLTDRPVIGGVIVGSLFPGSPRVLPPGSYYAAISTGLGTHVATGTPIAVLGNVVFSDGAASPCGGFCDNILSIPGSQEMIIQATQKNGRAGTNLYGILYGPRGSWLTILGVFPGDTVAGPLQVITGALQMTLNADLDLELLPTPATRWVVSLVE